MITFARAPTKRRGEKHCMRLEGKDYIVKDGDIVEFRFNV